MALRVGIIGPGSIGHIHARHYNELGANVVAVLCSSKQKGSDIANSFALELNIQVSPFDSIDDFFMEELDAVSICSPPSIHLEHIKVCLEKKIPVFCEKPFFWSAAMTSENIDREIKLIQCYQNRCLFVNTCNAIFLETIIQTEGRVAECSHFSFEFYTTGSYEGIEIAQDLLPHGLSFLIDLLGECKISNFTSVISTHEFSCEFLYGKCLVNFDFRENPSGPKHMRIKLNEHVYTRVQAGNGSSYQVSLVNNITQKVLPTEDPFKKNISRFLDYVINHRSTGNDGFDLAALNLILMAKCLQLAEKSTELRLKNK